MFLPVSGKKVEIFKISCIIYMTNCEAKTSPTHSFEVIHKDWSRNVFRKKLKFQNVTTSLWSYPIFIIFAPICREILLFLLNYGNSGLDFPFNDIHLYISQNNDIFQCFRRNYM